MKMEFVLATVEDTFRAPVGLWSTRERQDVTYDEIHVPHRLLFWA